MSVAFLQKTSFLQKRKWGGMSVLGSGRLVKATVYLFLEIDPLLTD